MGENYRLLVGLALVTCGCADEALDVSGQWCGRAVGTAAECLDDRSELGYLALTQSGEQVSGRMCEAYEKDCNDLQAGEVKGTRFSFFYEFSGFRVVGDFEARGDDTLVGNLNSTKCSCDTPMTLSRVP